MNDFKNRIKVNSTEDEILNYYDNNKNIIGTVRREEGINNSLLLKAVQIWIINPETKQVLMQQRSLKKENDPGMIDASASGHVNTTETPMQAIIREGKEELGTSAFEKLISTIKELMEIEIDFSKFGRKGRYITHEYIAFSTSKLEEYKKQDDEVENLFFMDYEKVKELVECKHKNIRIPYNKNTEKLFKIIDYEIENYNKQKIREE